MAASCSGATLSGNDANYGVVYTSADERLHRDAGPSDRHRVEYIDDLWLSADDHADLLGLREQRLGVFPDDPGHLFDHCDRAVDGVCFAVRNHVSGASDANYTFTYPPCGSVTVSPASLTITASSPSMTYGSTPPTITPSYSGFENNDSGRR